MNEVYESLFLFSSEAIVLLGSLLLLMFGAFTAKPKMFNFLALTFLVLALAVNYNLPSNKFYAFNNMLVINHFTKFCKMLVIIAMILVLLSTYKESFTYELTILAMLSTAGMLVLISASDLMVLYLGLELMSLPFYIMAAIDRSNSKSSEAGMKYFILGAVSSGLFLLGASLVYGFTGATSFGGIYDYYLNVSADLESTVMPIGFLIGLVFILVAMSFKIAAVPFHMWSPDVYQGSPTIITVLFASAPKVAGFAILSRLLLDPFAELYVQWQHILMFMAIASMIVGSLGAIMQVNFKRLLAYSSIGHVGFALCGLLTAEHEGLQGVLIYLAIYISMTIGSFGILMLLRKDGKQIENLEDFAGLSKSHPGVAFALTVLMISMAGVPPLAGFLAKFYILIPLIKSEMYITSIIFVVSSVIAAFYYLKVVKIVYFENEVKKLHMVENYSLQMVVTACTLFNLVLIIFPSSLVNIAELASIVLFS